MSIGILTVDVDPFPNQQRGCMDEIHYPVIIATIYAAPFFHRQIEPFVPVDSFFVHRLQLGTHRSSIIVFPNYQKLLLNLNTFNKAEKSSSIHSWTLLEGGQVHPAFLVWLASQNFLYKLKSVDIFNTTLVDWTISTSMLFGFGLSRTFYRINPFS